MAAQELPGHTPVLVREVFDVLALKEGDTYVDLTAGLGGHAIEAARRVGPGGRIVINDLDEGMLSRAELRLRDELGGGIPEIATLRGNFARAGEAIAERGWRADAVLADLGFSSAQMDDGARGMSFRREGPLDMRLDPRSPITAAELIAELDERELRDIFKRFGEEPMAGPIARKVVAARAEAPIETTGRFAEIVRSAVGPRRSPGIDPATRTFQALRIAINDELGSLERLLASVGRGAWLAEGARVAIISFHSLEDRMVKRAFAAMERAQAVTRGVVTAGEDEISTNPRSRSAKLRCVRVPGAS